MPYQVQQLIEDKGTPLYVQKDDTVATALTLMIEHDYSQLPVISKIKGLDIVEGMITYEGILRGIRNFKISIEGLKVRDVMSSAPVFTVEDDLFDILDELKETNAVLVTESFVPDLVGIVTSYDATDYFRNRTEDLMRVEDIEVTIKELIKDCYSDYTAGLESEINVAKLNDAIKRVSHRGQGERLKSFDELTLGEYINLLLLPETWTVIQEVFGLPSDSIRELLSGIRETRNSLAHFRGDISADQRDRLKFGIEWLAKRQQEFHEQKERKHLSKLTFVEIESTNKEKLIESPDVLEKDSFSVVTSTDYSAAESVTAGGRYAVLADWLQSQPGRVDQIQLTFKQIEEIIESELPASARNHRAWWANDSVGHTHSQLWLDAGWRTTYINLSEDKVTFTRIREREKAYIEFFGKLLNDLRRNVNFPIKDTSPDGASWIVIQKLPRLGQTFGSYVISFSRTKKLRVELYLDLLDKEQTKLAFENLLERKSDFEAQLGPMEWERLNNRRASRIALYKDGQITDKENLPELRKWAVETMYKLYNATIESAEKAIFDIKNNR